MYRSVCIGVLDKVIEASASLPSKTSDAYEALIKTVCESTEGHDQRFVRPLLFVLVCAISSAMQCYYVGGTKDAATYILRELSVPLSNGLPSAAICERLKKKDAAICELQYPVKIDLQTVDFSKLRVKELRKLIADNKGSCVGCSEKTEFIRELERIRDAAAKKTEL